MREEGRGHSIPRMCRAAPGDFSRDTSGFQCCLSRVGRGRPRDTGSIPKRILRGRSGWPRAERSTTHGGAMPHPTRTFSRAATRPIRLTRSQRRRCDSHGRSHGAAAENKPIAGGSTSREPLRRRWLRVKRSPRSAARKTVAHSAAGAIANCRRASSAANTSSQATSCQRVAPIARLSGC
jgi:hypothetical protein